jgi:hypothetical protein
MMYVPDGTFSCGARKAASIGPTAIPGWSQIDRLLLRMSPFVARSGHDGAVTAGLLSGAKRKTSAREEYFAFWTHFGSLL